MKYAIGGIIGCIIGFMAGYALVVWYFKDVFR